VVGDRPDAQLRAVELGVALLVTSNGTTPSEEVLAVAREHGTTVVCATHDPLLIALAGAEVPLARTAVRSG